MVEILRHCQPKGIETDRLDLNYFAPLPYSTNLKHGSVRGINNQQRRLKRCLLDKKN